MITALCTGILLVHMQPINALAAALLALLTTTVLGVYKPRGMTAYGWRKQYEGRVGAAR